MILSNVRVVIGGPQHSGKSVFAIYLQRALLQLEIHTYHYDYDPYSPTRQFILQEINSSQREKLKGKVSKSLANYHAKEFKQKSQQYEFVIGDLPGQMSEIVEILAKAGTHGIIVCDEKKEEQIKNWESMFKKLGVETICIVRTNLRGEEEVEENINRQQIINAKIANLDRDNISSLVPVTIQNLSQKIKTKLSL